MTGDELRSQEERADANDPADEEGNDPQDIPGMNPEDEAIPASPGLRRRSIVLALLFLGAILVFLVLFVVTHTGRGDGNGIM